MCAGNTISEAASNGQVIEVDGESVIAWVEVVAAGYIVKTEFCRHQFDECYPGMGFRWNRNTNRMSKTAWVPKTDDADED